MDLPNSKIKQEEEETIEIITSSANNAPSPRNQTIDIDEDDLQILSSKHSSKRKYPPACPVWYSLSSKNKSLNACRGTVKAVYTNLETGGFVYHIITKRYYQRNGNTDGDMTTTATENSQKLFLSEDQLSYAMNCPVKVKGINKNDPDKEIDGTILCPRPKDSSYSVMLYLDDNYVRVELGVLPGQITFRKEQSVETTQRKEGVPKKEETPEKNGTKQKNTKQTHDAPANKVSNDNTHRKAKKTTGDNSEGTPALMAVNTDLQNISGKMVSKNIEDGARSYGLTTDNGNKSNVKDITTNGNSSTLNENHNVAESNQAKHMLTSSYNMSERPQLRPQHRPGEKMELNNSLLDSFSTAAHKKAARNDYYSLPTEHTHGSLGAIEQPNIAKHNTMNSYRTMQGGASASGDVSTQQPPSRKSWVPPSSKQTTSSGTHLETTTPAPLDHALQNSSRDRFSHYGPATKHPNIGATNHNTMNATTAAVGNGVLAGIHQKSRVPQIYSDPPKIGGREKEVPTPLSYVTKSPPDTMVGRTPLLKLTLTVPSWVKDSTRRHLFQHIVGKSSDGRLGFKTSEIEEKTSCVVTISHPNINGDIDITIRSIRPRFEISKAREMVEDSLLDFLACDGSRARLMYELAMSLHGARNLEHDNSGVVQQRHFINGKEMVWMKLLDLPATWDNSDVVCFNLQALRDDPCNMNIFGNSLGNMNIPPHLCPPFALIWGRVSSEQVAKDTEKLIETVNAYQQTTQKNIGHKRSQLIQAPLPENTLDASRKRKLLSDVSTSFDSTEQRPSKTSTSPGNGEKISGSTKEATCVLTVPSWATEHGTPDNNLFGRLVGRKGGKIREIKAKTNCSVHLTNRATLKINITSLEETLSWRDVTESKRMIEESILGFIEDPNSERRLLYELAMTAQGSYRFRKSGRAVKRDCLDTRKFEWMNLLELPSVESNNGQLTHHGIFLCNEGQQHNLTKNTNCSVEVYGFRNCVTVLSNPYVLICGTCSDEVNEVTERVANVLERHMEKCPHHCSYHN